MSRLDVIVGEHRDFGRLEYWKWFFPTDTYDPKNNGRIHLFGKFYWRTFTDKKFGEDNEEHN